MEQEEAIQATDERSRLLAAARAMVREGEQKFSIARLCSQAGLPRDAFAEHFSSRTELMAAAMADTPLAADAMATGISAEDTAGEFAQAPTETPVEFQAADPAPVETSVQAPAFARATEALPKAATEPSVSTPDAWLERRLRVFERALSALEAKSDAKEREQARVITELEEKLAQFGAGAAPVTAQEAPGPAAQAESAPKLSLRKARVAPIEDMIVRAENPVAAPVEAPAQEMEQPEPEKKNEALLEITPARAVSLSREEMAEVVNLARGRAQAAALELEAMPPDRSRIRWLAVAGLSLLVLFLFIGLSLGRNSLTSGASAATADTVQADGVAHRLDAVTGLARMTALGDAGDANAQARLALIYLKGDGVAADPAAALRWTRAAADAGQPVAEDLMGIYYREGKVVAADEDAAFTWFSAAAAKGNLKAMHSLAIAYAQGQGTPADEKQAVEWFRRAAERGYVDSAFNLALLYERGLGVPQDLKQALTWYAIAAQMGDAQAAERVVALQSQISRQDATLAAFAAKNFTPLTPLGGANRL
jgi:TPR repeat protein/AcrR family transcriptional regulator